MGFLERAIRKGVGDAVGKAIGDAVQQAVEPVAADLANKAAGIIDKATADAEETAKQTSKQPNGLESVMANLQRSAENYATEVAKNVKVCPDCGEPCTADKSFCPSCGAQLPETTAAEGAVCSNCGKQNTIGTKFCSDCGTKLPAAVEEEQAAANRSAAVMAQWDEVLSHYPKWNCGGSDYHIEEYETGVYGFSAEIAGEHKIAKQAVEQYRQLLLENGFRKAGQYPSDEHLYKMEDGVCYHVDIEHCFESGGDRLTIGFDTNQPTGGYDYVKPEPKKLDLGDIFKFGR